MNDFIAKPVDVETLFSTIAKWLPDKDAGGTQDGPSIKPQPETMDDSGPGERIEDIASQRPGRPSPVGGSAIDPRALSTVFGDADEAIAGLLNSFITQTEEIITLIEAGCAEGDAAKVSFQAHKLKSSARTVGANSLSDLCFELEVAGRKEGLAEIGRLTAQIRPSLERVKDYVNNM